MSVPFDPRTVSLDKKKRHLLTLSEEDFRDSVVRQLFLKKGLKDGRDVCGPEEAGKDCYFLGNDKLGFPEIYAVQTKKGNLNLASKAANNLITAITQIRTCLDAHIGLLDTRSKRTPTKVYLCASGSINEAARNHIVDEVRDPRIEFLDASDIIHLIDDHMPLFWLRIDTKSHPYLSKLRDTLTRVPTGADHGQLGPIDPLACPVSTDNYVDLKIYRIRPPKAKGNASPATDVMPLVALRTRPERLILLLGEAGSGKSTSLKRIICIQCDRGLSTEENPTIPVLIRATEIARIVEPLEQHLLAVTQAVAPAAAFSDEELMSGRFLVGVDALDEVSDPGDRSRIVSTLIAFYRSYPKCKIILTSRNYAWLDAIDGIHLFSRFHVLPLDWDEASKIVKRLQSGKALSHDHTSELLRRLQQVHGMALNPLLVAVFASTSEAQRVDIPANITEMFKKFTEVMLGRWDAQKGFRQQYHAPLKDFLLRSTAFFMHSQRVTSMPLEELEAMLMHDLEERGHRPDADELIHEVIHRSGLFRVLGKQVEFSHFMLQEFFAGRGIEEPDLSKFIGDEWWQRALVFYFGDNPDRHSPLEKMCSALDQSKGADLAQQCLVLGLALQACYLVKTRYRLRLFESILRGTARATSELVPTVSRDTSPSPILDFVKHYIVARDGVSIDAIRKDLEFIVETVSKEHPEEYRDNAMFWILVGLIECGHVSFALAYLKDFRPKDDRLLLALHLGCFLFDRIRIGPKNEKEAARSATRILAPRIQHLREMLLTEVRTELLEARRGKLTELDAPPGGDTVDEVG